MSLLTLFAAPPAPIPPGQNNARENNQDVQKLQQQLQDIKDQVSGQAVM